MTGTKRPFDNSSGRVENGGFRAPERSVHQVREHRSAEKRHLQTGLMDLQTVSYKLIGRLGSGSSACEAVLALSGLPYETKDLDRWPDRQPPASLTALNPLGQVPVLILPDTTVLTESAAILMHVANLAKTAKLAPETGTPEHALFLRLMLFLAANVYMTDLCWFYPHRLSTDPSHASGIKAQSGIDQRRNWSTLEGIAASGEALLPSGFSAVDVYLAMLVSWTELEDFEAAYPRITSIARSVGQNPQIAPVWRRHGIA